MFLFKATSCVCCKISLCNIGCFPTTTTITPTSESNYDEKPIDIAAPNAEIGEISCFQYRPTDCRLSIELKRPRGFNQNDFSNVLGFTFRFNPPTWLTAISNIGVDASKVSESYGKVMVADFVLSLSRKVQDKLAGTGRWHVIKNRFGPDGITFPSKMNTSNGQIEIYDEGSLQGRNTQKQMDKGEEAGRKYLQNKFKELEGNV